MGEMAMKSLIMMAVILSVLNPAVRYSEESVMENREEIREFEVQLDGRYGQLALSWQDQEDVDSFRVIVQGRSCLWNRRCRIQKLRSLW